MEKSTKPVNRAIILAVLFVNQISIGGSYAWSVFAKPLTEFKGWEYSKVTIAYSILLVCLAFVGIIGGKLLDRFGPRVLMTVAALLWGSGWILTSFAESLGHLYITFGLLSGIGGGLFYNPAVTTAVRWFPDKRGLASGMVVGSAGLAPLMLAPIANLLLTQFGVMQAFRYLGLAFFIIAALTTWMLKNPPEGWTPKGYEPAVPAAAGEAGNSLYEKDWRGMFGDKIFYVLWLAFFGSAFSGIMIIGHTSGIGQELAGMTSMQAAWMVGIMAVANFCGRMLMGAISDKLGRYRTLMIALAVNVLDMLALSQVHGFAGFVVTLVVSGICFGAVLAVFPTITSELFGLKNMGTNYGIMFTAYGISAIVGPLIAANCQEQAGTYTSAFLVSAAVSAVSLILVIGISKASGKRKNK